MISFKEYINEAANTVLADINEIYAGYVLNNERWFDSDAEKQYIKRLEQVSPEAAEDAKGKAVAMAKEFVAWAKKNGYSGKVQNVWWTARPGSMSSAVGEKVDQKKNPTDILIRFTSGPANGFLGLSAKATKSKGDIGFKNPGVGTIDKALGTSLGQYNKDYTNKVIEQHDLPKSTKDRKAFLRASDQRQKFDDLGSKLLSELRDLLYTRLSQMTNDELKTYIIKDWMDAEVLYPPYIKVTGKGNRPPYTADVSDPIDNEKLKAMTLTEKIELTKVGNESIGIVANKKKIMKMRFKFESQKLASSLKMSGDPW